MLKASGLGEIIMAHGHSERTGILGFVAQTLNVAGTAAVSVYDAGRTVAEYSRDASMRCLGRTDEKQLLRFIRKYEHKKEELYCLIGRQSRDIKGPQGREAVNELISKVREHEETIHGLKDCLAEIKEIQYVIREQKTLTRDRKSPKRKAEAEFKGAVPAAMKKAKATGLEATKAVRAAIAKALKEGEFETTAKRSTFKKVASDLLDSEMENKVLAAAELGKIGNHAAVPVLMAAVKFHHPELISEIIKSLTILDDSRATPLLLEEVANPDYRVRTACLRGLFKQTDDERGVPVLIEALRDKHLEVRRTAITLIGWKGRADAVPELVQCLKDKEVKVRKAAVLALANIKDDSSVPPLINMLEDEELVIREKALDAIRLISGKTKEFDVHASGEALSEAVNNLRDWWLQKRPGKKEETVAAAAKPAEELTKAEAESAQVEFDQPALMKMKKAELLFLCERLGIKCDANLTKAEISQVILADRESAKAEVESP